jgi:hypothetical protein
MNWQRIETGISFEDPESPFAFRSTAVGVELTFRDWRNRLICFRFHNVMHFQCSYLCPLPDFPGSDFYRIEESPLIPKLGECLALGRTEPATHYIVAHNEDEWCEVVAESHDISIDDGSG